MHNRYAWPAVLVLAALLAGCNEAPAPAPDTRAADARAIRTLETSWQQLYATKDVDQIASVYADDASVFMPGAAVINGVEAIKTALKPMVKSKGFSLSFESTDVVVAKSGDLAYSQGTYTMTRTDPKTKKELTEKGKYVTVYKKQATGKWKALADIFNEDAPAAGAKSHKVAAARPTHAAHAAHASHKRR
jgi:uncharacterized protein (TIGR02246 family)